MSGANDMSAVLAEAFSTTKVASATPEDVEKRAQIEFFNGLCQEQGINIAELNDEQVDLLYKAAMDMRKEAGEMPPQFAKKDGDKKDKEPDGDKDDAKKEAEAKIAAAEAEFMAKKAAATKVAEADAMGRIMAHSFVAELDKIAEARGGEGFPFPPKKDGDKKDEKDEKKDGEKKEASSQEKAAALISAFQNKTAGAAPQAAGGGSSTPNFDEQACYHAIEMLKAAGVNADEAFGKVNAVYTLGLKDSTKLASAPDATSGLEIRALEICEAAGYPVTWNS